MIDDFTACAQIVERGDPARFRAVMAAPPGVRERLFALYAFNVEIARAPYVTSEPGIAEIRLQWWIDALGEIAQGGAVHKHEVVVPLALSITSSQALDLQAVVEARFHDVYNDPFADGVALCRYLEATSGTVLEVAAGMLGQGDAAPARAAGFAQGLANWLRAVPALKAHGKSPLPDESDAAIAALATEGLVALNEARGIVKTAQPAFYAVAGTRRVLKSARANPGRVLAGRLEPGPMAESLSLLRAVVLKSW
ncbi:squalene/phytoene synthase family protein [Alisedimentitalea sp. MJ-SS2]|uniref:squalene/phytoene synthase family protein n=1 Tax=Aliisedimentitalea sp. MJ-SS2 TaxID=3049795 RepID=UPI002914CB4B|nr:squalene/phytoene synthase family protein [Alisedimentitalea sp. MJ-SS2]MDU8926655.1 squalene/phytoene synthase family protein [Alisedimentitalea sp. MJ-SS2]